MVSPAKEMKLGRFCSIPETTHVAESVIGFYSSSIISVIFRLVTEFNGYLRSAKEETVKYGAEFVTVTVKLFRKIFSSSSSKSMSIVCTPTSLKPVGENVTFLKSFATTKVTGTGEFSKTTTFTVVPSGS